MYKRIKNNKNMSYSATQPCRSTTVTTVGPETSTTAMAANSIRLAWSIQNQGTNPLYVKLGASASSSDYTYILAAGTGAANGTGGSVGQSGSAIYYGVITIAGTAPSYSKLEMSEDR